MELATEIPGMVGDLADLDINRVGSLARQFQTMLGQDWFELAVELITVAMPFADLRHTVGGAREPAFREIAGKRPQAHGAAELVDAFQLAQFKDDARRCGRIELGRVGMFHATDVASVLDHHRLHAEADAEIRNLVLARIANGVDHALDTALAKTARHENAIESFELPGAVGPMQLLRLDPRDVDLEPMR